MPFKDAVDFVKNLNGIAVVILALLDKHFDLLPLNPAIRRDVIFISCISAVITGFGGYRIVRLTHSRWMAWISLAVFLLAVVSGIGLSMGWDVYLSPMGAAILARILYVICCAALGAAAGGFLGLS